MQVLERVERRRRRRRPRLLVVAALATLAAAGGYAAWRLQPETRHASAAVGPVVPVVQAPPAKPKPKAVGSLLSGPAKDAHGFRPALTAASAILVESGSGRVLWSRRAHQRRAIASTTKIMTAVLALKLLRPKEAVVVPPSVARVPLVKEGLRVGERVPAWKLLYGMLLYSANDDAHALAVAVAGSRVAFVSLMNAEASRLGLHDSHFAGPSGVIDRNNYSSAWDLAALTRYALRDARFRQIVGTHRKEVPWAAPTFAKIYVNKNLLLTRYRGATGVKTGWTTKAGHCLVASARRGGVELIAVVLSSRDQYRDATRLLNYGFRVVG